MSFMSGLGGGVRRGVDPVLRERGVRGRLVVCSERPGAGLRALH